MLNITKNMGLSNMIKESEWFCAIEGIAIAERIYNIYFEEYDCIPQNKKIGDLKMSVVQYRLFCDFEGHPIKRNRFKYFNVAYCSPMSIKWKELLRKSICNLLAELNYKRFMFKKLCILLIFSKLKVTKLLIDKYRMHNLYAIFAKLLNICKQIAGNLVNESGNVPRRGVVPKFSDLEVVALNMASEAVGIDSESLLFAKLQEYRVEIPNLISRRQYNDRRKITSSLCNAIRERMVSEMDGGEEYFCIDSKPIEVCRIARSKRCSMGKKDFRKAPGVGYCASQSMYYYGYKLHAVCGLSGVIHSFDLTKASVHDIHYLKDMKVDYSNCTVIGDRGYISAQVQLDLFETANIRLEVPYRCNQKEWKSTFPAFAKARKRIETLFSQLCDQFMIIRNYAKDTDGLFARIIGKISALTILQYINYKNEKPIGRVKYALF